MDGRQYRCCLCNKKTTPDERRPVGLFLSTLRKHFSLDVEETDRICNKCRHKCRNIKESNTRQPMLLRPATEDEKKDPTFQSPKQKRTKSPFSSPPTIPLSIPSSSQSHGYCFVCKKPGPKLVTVSHHVRMFVFIQKEIIIPTGARCCIRHLDNEKMNDEALHQIRTNDNTTLNKTSIIDLIKYLRDKAFEQQSRLDFDDDCRMSDEDYRVLTGFSLLEFHDIVSSVASINSSRNRSKRTCIGILLMKLRSALSNKMLAVLFQMTKSQVRRAIVSARTALIRDFVPYNLGFQHITREEVIENHTRQLARDLLSDDITSNPAILVLDGTYVYIQKSSNFAFARRSYSMHKHRPLIKPMMVVTTSGYIVSVLGPYLADSKNNDANILKHMICHNAEELRNWLQEDDVFVVDRGFRDAQDVLEDLGIRMEMPAFMTRGDKQLPTLDSNKSRVVTKVRWIVEAANGRIKQWQFLAKTLPNSQIPFIGDYVRIVAALCNKYRPPLSVSSEEDQEIAAKMERVENEGLDRRGFNWTKVDSENVTPEFPKYNDTELRQLTLGVYQLRMAKSYTHEHMDVDGGFEILISDEIEGMVCAKIQSRHISAKQYKCWITYTEGDIDGWYCKCKAGTRVVGMCGHITSVIWYLSFGRHQESLKGVRNWTTSLEDASDIHDVIDGSDSDGNDNDVEE
ncbi:uncharacterized protein LOC125673390 [Ostrea edulis]|uniref:uncharacterized protein LOC125673390 n=1 Tax=Ostrea edulis TaxID=37623 RepID=UPI0024AEC25F|nr:uncharacterized protein LOC125673390 [Ostrea edulis]